MQNIIALTIIATITTIIFNGLYIHQYKAAKTYAKLFTTLALYQTPSALMSMYVWYAEGFLMMVGISAIVAIVTIPQMVYINKKIRKIEANNFANIIIV